MFKNEKNKETRIQDKYALEFYQEFNSSFFYNHYIANYFKNKSIGGHQADNLEQDEDPNFGIFKDTSGCYHNFSKLLEKDETKKELVLKENATSSVFDQEKIQRELDK